MGTETIVFVDTETTGFTADNACWQVGIIRCIVENGARVVHRTEQEFVLPYLTQDLHSNAFQRGAIISASAVDCDDAAEHARAMMCGAYDRDEFVDHMREFLEEVREDRASEIGQELEDSDSIYAWNAKFDEPVLGKICPPDTYSIRCAMSQFRRLNPGVRYKLATAADHYGIGVDGVRHHTALYDATLLEKVWFRMNRLVEDDSLVRIRRAFGR